MNAIQESEREPTLVSNCRDVTLRAVIYHYVRDLPRTRFPRIKGLLTDDFKRQVAMLCERYEMATLESALAFLEGKYHPARELCLLTFDDGLKEHFTTCLPILAERRVQGLFFMPTWCVEEHRVASVHKNHFLMAALEFEDYRRAFLDALSELRPDIQTQIDSAVAQETYRLDTPEIASFKFLVNFRVPEDVRDRVLDTIFAQFLGAEAEFAEELYLSWDEARSMQDGGMLFGGHSHRHTALATLDDKTQIEDLKTCTGLLRGHLQTQPLWPFSVPYGQPHTYNTLTLETIKDLEYCCSFTTDMGVNEAGNDLWHLRRLDTRDI
jgi:peptidoglycan/xylan/chitin deacetylase (PgdA/CDA1 family)